MPSPRFLSRRRFLAWSLTISGIPLLVGCAKEGERADTGGATSATKGSTTPGVLRYALREEPTTLDPHLVISDGTYDLLQNSYEGLVAYDENNRIVPLLAAALPTISDDGKTYTFELREGVRFHDGTPLTAKVVRENALRILSKPLASPRATLTLDDVAGAKEYIAGKTDDVPGVQVVGALTVRFVLAEPRTYFLDKLTTFLMVSPAAVAKAERNERGIPELGTRTAIGTGPFLLSEYVRQSKVIQTAYDGYHGAKPKLTRIERPILIDPKTARNLYDSGSLDVFLENVAEYEADKSSPATKGEIAEWAQAGVFYVTLGLSAPVMREKRVRQALSRAIDRNVIAQSALVGMNPPANGFLAPGLLGSNPADETPDTVKYDPDAAKKLIADAGYGPEKPLAFTILYSEGSVTAAKVTQVLKEQWDAIGVEATLQELEWGTLLQRMKNGDFDAVYSGWSASPDPHSTLWNLLASDSPNNWGKYDSKAFDDLCGAGDREQNETKRGELYKKAVAVALDEAPILPVVFANEVRLIRPYVSGIRYNLSGMLPHTATGVS
ncbi:MAG: peptide ABC transporter substrate-binding protein [Akkermansiaceae bacterium]|nr:peptide ABC transporter substrate-binding protein [Armatimonadota bacterium]